VSEFEVLERLATDAQDQRRYVCITDAGRRRYEDARPAHRAALAETLG
jgi:hypothetical protein